MSSKANRFVARPTMRDTLRAICGDANAKQLSRAISFLPQVEHAEREIGRGN